MGMLVRYKPCLKLTSDNGVSILRRDSEEKRDVAEGSIEKLSSISSSDAERDSSNKVFGGCVTRSKGELVDARQIKLFRENENTVLKTVLGLHSLNFR